MAIPFLKWAGGKRKLVPAILPLLPADFKERLYCEPFVGGGALFFHCADQLRAARLSDRNVALIATYRAVQQHPDRVLCYLQEFAARNTQEDFYRIRADYNSAAHTAAVSAAMFIYLNKTCFNGLYRVNRRGEFNVPFGNYKNPRICDPTSLEQASAALQGVQLQQGDFVRVACTEPAFIYADPPYPVVASSFAHYTSGGFAWAEHEFLHRRVRQWVAQGHKVLLSYPDLLAIRELYADFSIAKVQGSRAIAANGNRKPVAELLLRSYTS